MNKSLADLKAGLDYAKSKLEEETLSTEDREYWVNKITEYKMLLENSVMLLEG